MAIVSRLNHEVVLIPMTIFQTVICWAAFYWIVCSILSNLFTFPPQLSTHILLSLPWTVSGPGHCQLLDQDQVPPPIHMVLPVAFFTCQRGVSPTNQTMCEDTKLFTSRSHPVKAPDQLNPQSSNTIPNYLPTCAHDQLCLLECTPCRRYHCQKSNPGPCGVWWVVWPWLTLLPLTWFSLMGALHWKVWVTHPSLLTSLANSSRQVSTGSFSWPSAMASWQSSNE